MRGASDNILLLTLLLGFAHLTVCVICPLPPTVLTSHRHCGFR